MMKRILVALVAMVPMLGQAADLTPGTIQLRGNSNLGFAMGSSEDKGDPEKTDVTKIGLGLTGLYTVINNLGVGLALDFSNESREYGTDERGSTVYKIGPAVSYDYPVGEKAAVFGLGRVQYVSDTATSKTAGVSNPDEEFSGFGFGVDVGAKYFLAKSFSIDGAVGYSWSKVTGDAPAGGTEPETTDSGFGFNVGLSVYFDVLAK